MRKLLLIGIGAGPSRPYHHAGDPRAEQGRRLLCDRQGRREGRPRPPSAGNLPDPYQGPAIPTVAAPDPARDRAPSSYEKAVKDWHASRAAIFEKMIGGSLAKTNAAAFSSGRSSALRQHVADRRAYPRQEARSDSPMRSFPESAASRPSPPPTNFPARDRRARSHHDRPQRRGRLSDGFDNIVVMLDANCAFKAVKDPAIDILLGRLCRNQGRDPRLGAGA